MASSRGQFQVDFLRSVIESGGVIDRARFSLQRGPLKQIEPMYWLVLQQTGVRSHQELPWTPDLERYLIERHQRLETEADEAERFAAILLNNIESAADEYGKDYTQAIFVEVLRDRPEFQLERALDRAAVPAASRNGRHYGDCRLFLEHSIDGVQGTAQFELGYESEQAECIAKQALEITLDETFHISGVDLLFPKHG